MQLNINPFASVSYCGVVYAGSIFCTGMSYRAVMFSDVLSDPVIIEVDLKVKGATESEDGYLSFLVSPLTCSGMLSHVFKCAYTTKLSRLEFSLGHIVFSVEATIFVSHSWVMARWFAWSIYCFYYRLQ